METKSYEALFEELTDITRRLNEGNTTLEETVSLYERGMGLARACADLLDLYEDRVSALKGSAAEETDDI